MSISLYPQQVEAVGGISLTLSLLSIVPDDDISVALHPFHALLVSERIVQFKLLTQKTIGAEASGKPWRRL